MNTTEYVSNHHLPETEPTVRSFLERLRRWEAQGRVAVIHAGRRRSIRREDYYRLVREDAVARVGVAPSETDKDLIRLGYERRAS